MQCHLWRMGRHRHRRNHADMDEDSLHDSLSVDDQLWQNIVGGPNGSTARGRCKRQLPQEIVNTLPLRVYGEKEPIPQNDNQSISSTTTATATAAMAQEQASCVICLESFAQGDILRTLPCNHEYHRDCIGNLFNMV